jgi:molybdate transport system substrate-binding protein
MRIWPRSRRPERRAGRPRALRLGLLTATLPVLALAADLRVAAGGAVQAALDPLAAAFSRLGGIAPRGDEVRMEYAPMGVLSRRLAGGASFDVLVLTPEVLEGLTGAGTLQAGPAVPLGEVGIGVAFNERAPLPAIGTPDALRQTLLSARSIVYIDPKAGTSGRYVAQMIERLGIAEKLRSKTVLGSGGRVVEPVGTGAVEIGIHQISEILPVRGVRLAGELPAPFQHDTRYVAVVPRNAGHEQAALAFVHFLSGAPAQAVFRSAGLRTP